MRSSVIAQRLVRKLCPHCRKKHPATDKEKLILKRSLAEEVEIYEPGGCKLCNNTGYFGRTGVFEIMEVNEEMRKLIADDATTEEMIAAAKKTACIHFVRMASAMYLRGYFYRRNAEGFLRRIRCIVIVSRMNSNNSSAQRNAV